LATGNPNDLLAHAALLQNSAAIGSDPTKVGLM
jgi:hypothetical protein